MKLEGHIEKTIERIVEFLPHLVSALLVLIVGLWIIKRVANIAARSFEKRNLEISLRTFLKSLISIGLKIVLIVTVAGMIGIGTTSFVTILGAAGLAVGLALQGSLSNFAGGVLILIFKPFKVGDSIEAQGQTGEVIEIQIFNTILLTAEHKTVILPNGAVSNGTIINTTRHGNVRVDIEISVSIENDISKVKNIIRETIDANPRILKNPEPIIVTGKIENGAIGINIRPYCSPDNGAIVVSEINENIKAAFDKYKVKHPVQTRYIHNLDLLKP